MQLLIANTPWTYSFSQLREKLQKEKCEMWTKWSEFTRIYLESSIKQLVVSNRTNALIYNILHKSKPQSSSAYYLGEEEVT